MGIAQGLAEMLPVSSSAHLVLLPWMFKFEDPGLAFDVALHVGTLLAVLGYFWRDWVKMLTEGLKMLHRRKVETDSQRMIGYLLVASIPGAIFGFLLDDYAETVFRSPLLIAAAMVVMGAVLLYADSHDRANRELANLKTPDAFKVGIAQALAIIPGVSRSGATMTAGLFLGFKREDVARFSFLMSAPIIFGAALVKIPDISTEMLGSSIFWVGLVTAAGSSLLAIHFLLGFLKKHRFNVFAYYRFALAAIVIIIYFWRM